MAEDAERGWLMNQDDNGEVAPEDDGEEQAEAPRRGKARHRDEEAEEEEEEGEAEGPSKKRRKVGGGFAHPASYCSIFMPQRSHKKQSRVNRFLDMEAQVDSEDEPESSGDEGEGEKTAHQRFGGGID